MLQHHDARGDRALRQLNLAHVVLGEHDLLSRAGFAGPEHDDLTLLAPHHDPLAELRRQRIACIDLDQARPVDDAAVEQARQQIDDPGAADAERIRLADGVDVDVVVDRDPIDGAERAAHAVTDLGALERRAGRRRAGPEPLARAQQHLAVGPDVDGDADLGAVVDARRERDADGIGADEAGDERQQAHARLRRHLQEELARGQGHRVAHHRRVGREADVRGIDAEQDVMHARVADDDDLVDPLGQHAGVAADLLDVLVQEADDPRVELPQIAGIELREGDARHEVAAEDRLRIQAGDRPELLAGLELDQGGHDARRADVDREAELHRRGVAALDRKDPLPSADPPRTSSPSRPPDRRGAPTATPGARPGRRRPS